MPHILILHASLGTGHASAAEALGAAFVRSPDVQVSIVDTLDHASTVVRVAATEAYRRMSERAPLLYKMLYASSDAEDAEDSVSGNRWLAMLERPFLTQLTTFVQETAPDAIICTHPLPAHVLHMYRQEGRLTVPMYIVVTDFMAHGTWLLADVDGYFLPSDVTRDVLVVRGVDPDRLHVTGIPVHLEIAEEKPTDAVRQRLDLPTDRPVVTLFGGGIDPERVRRMVTGLLQSPTEGVLVVVAGRNEALADQLSDVESGPLMDLVKLGMFDYVDDLVAASDLVITKAGGLIVSEVLARGTPMVIIEPLPGQEEWNADYVAAAGAGLQLRMPEMVPSAVLALLSQPERLTVMRTLASAAGRPRSGLDIAAHVLADLSREGR